jgi:hypothetical protein
MEDKSAMLRASFWIIEAILKGADNAVLIVVVVLVL